MSDQVDCLVIGAGPAGLTAALYLARFKRNVRVVHDSNSRALLIPRSHNAPAFPGGVNGSEYVAKVMEHVRHYDVPIDRCRIEKMTISGSGFVCTGENFEIAAATVILATGVRDAFPDFAGWEDAVEAGRLRSCPVCDGYEATDQKIGVIGPLEGALKKGVFLRTYSADVTVFFTDPQSTLDEDHYHTASEAAIKLVPASSPDIIPQDSSLTLMMGEERHVVDTLYAAMGCHPGIELAVQVGAKTDSLGALVVDDNQRTSVEGLYAAGDVVSDLDQIAVAVGHAAKAATAIHNALPKNLRMHKASVA
jgi:thioredoxin reductase (NADPH)